MPRVIVAHITCENHPEALSVRHPTAGRGFREWRTVSPRDGPPCDSGGMTTPGAVLNEMVPPLVRLVDRPGALLLRAALFGVTVLALLGLAHVISQVGWPAWLPLGSAGLLAVPVAVLWVRRRRLQIFTTGLGVYPSLADASCVVVIHDDGSAARAESLSTYDAAIAENRIRRARFMPRVEAAQRAAVAAAGGTVHAPYLQDDLRVTIVALFGTLAAIPLSTLGSVVTAISLLS